MQKNHITKLHSLSFPTRYGTGQLHVYRQSDSQLAYAIVFGELDSDQEFGVFCRIHSACITSETFEAVNCDCREQLQQAFAVASQNSGVIIYLPQEGRGNGIEAKLKQMALEWQQPDIDTIEAFLHFGYPADNREYDVAVSILKELKVKKVTLYTASPDKVASLESAGILVSKRVNFPIHITNQVAKKNVQAKQKHLNYFTETMSLQALFIGYATVDQIDGQQYPGGAGGAMALNAAQMQIESALCAPLSQDSYGQYYQKILRERNVDISLCATDSPGMPVCTINDPFAPGSTRTWQSNGSDIHFSKMKLTTQDLEPYGLIFLCNAAPSIVREVAQNVRGKKIVYIPGPQIVHHPDWVVPEIFSSTAILFSNQEETEVLEQFDPIRVGATHWVKTFGEAGGLVHSKGEEYAFTPEKDVTVIDTTGAGDSFALAYSYEWYQSRDVLASIAAGKKRAAAIIQQKGTLLHD